MPTHHRNSLLFRKARSHGVTISSKIMSRCSLAMALLSFTNSCRPSTTVKCGGEKGEIRILIDSIPQTLNPRYSTDVYSQRLVALIFQGLTALSANLRPLPSLAKSWRWNPRYSSWDFSLDPELTKTTDGRIVSHEEIYACIENYRTLAPPAFLLSSFPGWKKTSLEKQGPDSILRLYFSDFDPYVPKNIHLLRFFRSSNGVCKDGASTKEPLISSGKYSVTSPMDHPRLVALQPFYQKPSEPKRSALNFVVVSDDHTRAVKLQRGEADAVLNVLSISKQVWLNKNYPEKLKMTLQEGANVTYLAFNLKNPVLANKAVRQAIAHALPVADWIKYKFMGIVSPAVSFLSPLLEEAWVPRADDFIKYDTAMANQILDGAGFPRKKDLDGYRFSLKIATTSSREGYETALLLQDALKQVGIELILVKYEPAAHLAAVKRRDFDLYASRWIGVADASILYRTLHSKQPNKRASFFSEETDRQLLQMTGELSLDKRKILAVGIQKKMVEELPYLPLWFWKNTLLHRRDLKGIEPSAISITGGFQTFEGAFCETP